jgi:ATP phosphoribosyltransferase
MEEHSCCLSKLREAIDKCEDIKELSQAIKAIVKIKTKLEKMFNEAKDRLKEAQEFLNRVVAEKLQVKK